MTATHVLEQALPGAQPAYLANGLVGLRVGQIPLPGGTALVNGFVGVSAEKSTEEYAPAPYPVGLDIRLEGVWLSRRPDLARFIRQELDFSCGELRSVFSFTAGGRTAVIEVLTFCSRSQPTLALQETAVVVDGDARLTLLPRLGREGLPGRLAFRCQPRQNHDFIIAWEGAGAASTVGAAGITELVGEGLERRWRNDFGHEADAELTFYEIAAKQGRRVALRQYGSLVPGLMHGEPHWQAARLAAAGTWFGFDVLREQNRAAWAELWKGRPLLVGADRRWQEAADASFFYLHSSVHQSSPCSIAPFGLSRHAEYLGHVFWDADTFMFPPLLLTAPTAARGMMDYRVRCAPEARMNALLNGYRGMQFPGQSSGGRGFEGAPFYAGSCGGIREHHITLDVAFALAQYVHATGDELFLRQQAWPVLEAVAEWILSRVTRTARGCEIRHITGIDEGYDNVHNNAAMNMQARIVLREAAGFARRLGFQPPAAWLATAEAMFLAIDPATGAILKHEGYEYRGGMCVPETLAAYFPFGAASEGAADRATIDYHLGLAHTYLGMPMLSATLGVLAARAGRRSEATRIFEEGILSHRQAPFLQFNETSKAFDGPITMNGDTVFVTNPASFLLALYLGLPGLAFGPGEPAEWAAHAVAMPDAWEAIEIERVWVRGREARLSARQGEARARLVPLA